MKRMDYLRIGGLMVLVSLGWMVKSGERLAFDPVKEEHTHLQAVDDAYKRLGLAPLLVSPVDQVILPAQRHMHFRANAAATFEHS